MPKKPKLGQNFLTDDTARHNIVAALGDLSGRTVLEIGPGYGSLTTLIAPRVRRLILVELDRALAAELAFRFRDQPHVEVLHADILKTDLIALATAPAQTPTQTLDIIGNLPYYITSDILLHLCAAAPVLHRAVLMMQREVADRVTAIPGVRDYGLLSATTQLHAQAESLFTLPPAAFSPPPDVFSSVVRLHFTPRFQELQVDSTGFDRFLRQAFAQKRKTLANNLRNAGHAPDAITAAWPAPLNPQARAEELPLEQMAKLYNTLRA